MTRKRAPKATDVYPYLKSQQGMGLHGTGFGPNLYSQNIKVGRPDMVMAIDKASAVKEPRISGQRNMGAFLNANKDLPIAAKPKPLSTEHELAAVQQQMGKGPNDLGLIDLNDGEEIPTKADINILAFDPEKNIPLFDKKYGDRASEHYLLDRTDGKGARAVSQREETNFKDHGTYEED